jgi:Cysteine-rich secretory protein family
MAPLLSCTRPRSMWRLLWTLSVLASAQGQAQQQQQQQQQQVLETTTASSSSSTSSSTASASASLRGAAAAAAISAKIAPSNERVEEKEEEDEKDLLSSSEPPPPLLIPAAYAEYHEKVDGEYEITVHRVPIQTLDNGQEIDPWMQLAISQGIDLNDYNVTYEDGTWETLEEDHRRNLLSVTSAENNNARFCTYARRQRGLNQLSWRADLIQQAKKQAAYMARVRHIEHRAYLATGIAQGWGVITENVCQNVNIGYGGAFTSLMNDLGHRNNILHPRIRNIGVGIVRNGPYYYMCQIFLG